MKVVSLRRHLGRLCAIAEAVAHRVLGRMPDGPLAHQKMRVDMRAGMRCGTGGKVLAEAVVLDIGTRSMPAAQ